MHDMTMAKFRYPKIVAVAAHPILSKIGYDRIRRPGRINSYNAFAILDVNVIVDKNRTL